MWSRAALKEHARYSINQNYWRTVLAAIILTLVLGSVAATSSVGSSVGSRLGSFLQNNGRPSVNVEFGLGNGHSDENNGDFYDYEGGTPRQQPNQQQERSGVNPLSAERTGVQSLSTEQTRSMLGRYPGYFWGGITVGTIIFLCILDLVLDIFIKNPLEVGCRRYFYRNLTTRAELREVAFGFDRNYSNICKTMFFRDLYTYLWTLLFVIPGIVKSYEYKMVPYLLAEYPDMTKEDAFAISRYMMDGNKWNAFVLDLSFIPWKLLSLITFGILDIFWTNPYVYQTDAALYDAIMEQKQPFAEV